MPESGASLFSKTYVEARQRFRAAASSVETHKHEKRGAEGEELTLDTTLIGDANASALFIVSSGTHGPEGFAGSACQLGLLQDEALLARAKARGVAILLIHAVNPYGFSHLSRTNEDNIDLNRNFNDFTAPYPRNPLYESMHEILVPKSWPPSPENERTLAEAMKQPPRDGVGVSSGQVSHPAGLFYAGTAPSWSNRTVRAVLQRHGRNRKHLAWIDVHTGLGPYGHGEKIFGRHSDETRRRAESWWGRDLIVSTAPESVSPRTTGHITSIAPVECPGAAITPMTLEYGTHPNPVVRQALRGEAWLFGHPEASDAQKRSIRRAVRNAFCIESDDWKGMVLGQFRAVAIQTLNGLSGGET